VSVAAESIRNALEANPLREPPFRSVIQSLGLPPTSRGLEAGCGLGLQARLLADAAGSPGRITGLDILLELLAYGLENVNRGGYSDRLEFFQGDVSSLPFADDSFDWAWSADCIGYPASETTPILEQLIRVVKPGGSIVILGWSSQQQLPGYPLLEARLNATCSSYIPFLRDVIPGLNFMRSSRSFRAASLEDVSVQTFVGDVHAPLSSGERLALLSLFQMLWGTPQEGVSPQDWKEYQRLCEPESPDLILVLPEYYAFFTYSMFRGKVPLV
jgi:demethylmenaquinone methyltransferase/2-methoxy-6-polyprenyl-1,4-benzoquinol methylase